MIFRTVAIVAAVAALAACNNATSVQNAAASAVEQAAASMAAEASAVAVANNLTGSNEYLNLPAGFADKKGDAALMPEGVAQADVLLLQYDESRNISVSVVKAAEFAGDAAALADKLKTALAADKSLADVKVAVEGNQVNYSYTFAESDSKAAESCAARLGEDKSVTTFCANGTDVSADELQHLISGSLK